jgi:toxin ParE1/3/4
MGRIVRRPQAKADLYDIWGYVFDRNPAAADRLLFDFEKRFAVLADAPEAGVRKLPAFPNIRVFPFKAYLIVYSPLDDRRGIELVRLLHGARDWRRLFEVDEI